MTLAVSVVISSVNALTLSPALAALLLRAGRHRAERGPLGWFNRVFEGVTRTYERWVAALVRRLALVGIVTAVLLAAAAVLFVSLPTAFLPNEDQGVIFIDVQLPAGATVARTDAIVRRAQALLAEMPGIQDVVEIGGFSLLAGSGANKAFAIAVLEPWDVRQQPELAAESLVGRIWGTLGAIPGANVMAFSPPPIRGLGSTSGFELQLLGPPGTSAQELADAMQILLTEANLEPRLTRVFGTFRTTVPQIEVEVDRTAARSRAGCCRPGSRRSGPAPRCRRSRREHRVRRSFC